MVYVCACFGMMYIENTAKILEPCLVAFWGVEGSILVVSYDFSHYFLNMIIGSRGFFSAWGVFCMPKGGFSS